VYIAEKAGRIKRITTLRGNSGEASYTPPPPRFPLTPVYCPPPPPPTTTTTTSPGPQTEVVLDISAKVFVYGDHGMTSIQYYKARPTALLLLLPLSPPPLLPFFFYSSFPPFPGPLSTLFP
jgi:hypothetical protein